MTRSQTRSAQRQLQMSEDPVVDGEAAYALGRRACHRIVDRNHGDLPRDT